MKFNKERFWRVVIAQKYILKLNDDNTPCQSGEVFLTTLEIKSEDAQGAVDVATAWIVENNIENARIATVKCNNYNYGGELIKLHVQEDKETKQYDDISM